MAALKLLNVILIALYPVIVYLGISSKNFFALIIGLAVIFLLKLLTQKHTLTKQSLFSNPSIKIGALLILVSWWYQNSDLLLYYPLIVNGVLFAVFFSSLFTKTSTIETFARLKQPNLNAEEVAYTRKVTQAWCAFFVVNLAIAYATLVSGSLEVWAVYNGFISYLLIGAMVGIEWLIRPQLR